MRVSFAYLPRKVMGCDVWPDKAVERKGLPGKGNRRQRTRMKRVSKEWQKYPTNPTHASFRPLPNAFLIMQRTLRCQKTMTLISRSLWVLEQKVNFYAAALGPWSLVLGPSPPFSCSCPGSRLPAPGSCCCPFLLCAPTAEKFITLLHIVRVFVFRTKRRAQGAQREKLSKSVENGQWVGCGCCQVGGGMCSGEVHMPPLRAVR